MKKYFSFLSNNKQTRIHGVAWLPQTSPRAVLQIVHGMAEFVERYDHFAEYLAKQGWVVVGHDHLGHGQSINQSNDYGYFHKNNSYQIVIDDTQQVTKMFQEKFPSLPYFILGHSMGSFILRNYLMTYSLPLTGAILMGTGSQKKELALALPLLKNLNRVAPKKSNHVIDKIAFGHFADSFPENYSKFDWLSKNQQNVKEYLTNPKTGFVFTNNGFYTLFQLIQQATKEKWALSLNKDTAFLVISGEKDPVGDFGRGPRKVANELRQANIKDLTLHLYNDLRHEILNEEEQELIMSDLLEWMEVRISN